MQAPAAIILAAGHGKRMKSTRAKVLHDVCGQPMIRYVVDAVRGAGIERIIVVVGFGADQVRAMLGDEPGIEFATQAQQLGTGDAVKSCRPLLEGFEGPALVIVGDEPLLRSEPLADLLKRHREEGTACLLGTAEVPDPAGFGRILRDSAGRFLRIVEQRDCTPDEAKIREINPSCYVFQLPLLWEALDRITTGNAQHEYYLTDAPDILQSMGHKVAAIKALDAEDVLGINTREHLAQANAIMQARIQGGHMAAGVSIVDPRNTYIDPRATIGPDTVIFPFTVISGRVAVGSGCRVGPFAHLRDGSKLEDGAEVGAFVELSRTAMGPKAVARHLAYLGDATVGGGANIGAGAVTANFDGQSKHSTAIGPDSQIGANSVLIAPVRVGARATVGAGTVVPKNHDVPEGQTVAGAPAQPLRPRQ